MTTFTETIHDFEGLVSEDNDFRSRDQITIKSGAGVVIPMTVLGKIVSGTSASAAKSGGNTGNGTFVLDGATPIQPRAKLGVYTLRCITAVTNGGVFRLEDPDGIVLGDSTITGGAGGTVVVSEHIKGVLTDGSSDFVVGDGFDITISALSSKFVPHAPAATDGSQIACAVLLVGVDATSADKQTAAAVRACQVRKSALTYNAATNTDPLKGAVDASLATFGIIVRS